MLNLSKKMTKARKEAGLTQGSLAQSADLSLATIQNIENGKANPSYSTLEEIFKILGYKISIETNEIRWERLFHLGLPLIGIASESDLVPTAELLAIELTPACRSPLIEREIKAVHALLKAINDHYPKVWRKYFRGPLFQVFLESNETHSNAKLRRMALYKISRFL